MPNCPDRDCAHMRGDYTPNVIAGKIVGAKLTNWCCDLDGGQSCGTEDCPTDRRYAALQYIPAVNAGILENKYA